MLTYSCDSVLIVRQIRRRLDNGGPSLSPYHAGSPIEQIHLDILGPFPESERGNKYVLGHSWTNYTKSFEAYPVPDQGAEATARTLVFEFMVCYGASLTVHTDQGRNFESDLFRRVCSLFEMAKTCTTPYHPASNRQVE